jgi:hypothetical protein
MKQKKDLLVTDDLSDIVGKADRAKVLRDVIASGAASIELANPPKQEKKKGGRPPAEEPAKTCTIAIYTRLLDRMNKDGEARVNRKEFVNRVIDNHYNGIDMRKIPAPLIELMKSDGIVDYTEFIIDLLYAHYKEKETGL